MSTQPQQTQDEGEATKTAAARPASLSQVNNKRRKRSGPPMRLSWPGPSIGTQQSQETTTNNGMLSHSQPSRTKSGPAKVSATKQNKRQRTLLAEFQEQQKLLESNNENNADENKLSLLWTDQYAPTNRKELCVAPKKVQEIADWLVPPGGGRSSESLLILVGKPGIGKSTMVRVLAQELQLELLEWSDSYSTGGGGNMETLSPINSFAQFLQQGGVGYSSLAMQPVSKTTTTAAANKNNANASSANKQQVILWEELPNATMESQERLREILTRHVQNSQVKTIWIYSDCSEGQHKPQDLERLISPEVLYKHSKIVQINPVTKAQLKKCLERIAKAEGRFSVHKDFCEHMYLQCGGDIRNAILSLQFDQACHANNTGAATLDSNSRRGSGKKRNSKTNKKAAVVPLLASTGSEHPRDTQWTAFHALGKLLYAKREPRQETLAISTTNNTTERPPLTFDPEGVLEHCDLDVGHAMTYLGFHCVDFFTDIEELSTAFELFSDAAFLLEQTTNYSYSNRYRQANTTVTCPIFPEGYVMSLAGRAVAHANHHPAPSRFRQLQAPKILEIRRKRNDNAHQLSQLQRRMSMLSFSSLSAPAAASQGSFVSFVMDELPFLRDIMPNDVDACLNRLHSSGSEHVDRFFEHRKAEEEAAIAILEEEQRKILEEDDIVEFDSDDDDDENSPKDDNRMSQENPKGLRDDHHPRKPPSSLPNNLLSQSTQAQQNNSSLRNSRSSQSTQPQQNSNTLLSQSTQTHQNTSYKPAVGAIPRAKPTTTIKNPYAKAPRAVAKPAAIPLSSQPPPSQHNVAGANYNSQSLSQHGSNGSNAFQAPPPPPVTSQSTNTARAPSSIQPPPSHYNVGGANYNSQSLSQHSSHDSNEFQAPPPPVSSQTINTARAPSSIQPPPSHYNVGGANYNSQSLSQHSSHDSNEFQAPPPPVSSQTINTARAPSSIQPPPSHHNVGGANYNSQFLPQHGSNGSNEFHAPPPPVSSQTIKAEPVPMPQENKPRTVGNTILMDI